MSLDQVKNARCNCENAHCGVCHGDGCTRPSGTHLVMYVGAVCDGCWNEMPARYRVDA